jgi:hypothetical protein
VLSKDVIDYLCVANMMKEFREGAMYILNGLEAKCGKSLGARPESYRP